MKKNWVRLLNGEVSVIRLDVMLYRTPMPNGVDKYEVVPMDEDFLLSFVKYVNPKTLEQSKTPRHSGGKKPYVMLMVDEVERLRKDGVKNVEELVGYLACLSKNIEWNTGKLVKKRTKKPLKYKDLQGMFPCSKNKLNRILKDLKEQDLLYGTQEGYFISPRIIKKGKSKTKEGQ